jgi:hypothetical protein
VSIADTRDWSRPVAVVPLVVGTVPDFADWTEAITQVTNPTDPNADFPDWTDAMVIVSGSGTVPPVTPPLSTNALAWWVADSLVGTADGSTISFWLDSSGHGNHLNGSLGTGGGPQYSTTTHAINGHPAVFFTQGHFNTNNLATASTTIGPPLTIGAVCTQPTNPPNNGQWFLTCAAAGQPGFQFRTSDGAPLIVNGSDIGQFPPVPTPLAPHSYIWVVNGSSSVVIVDGVTHNMSGSMTTFGFVATPIELSGQNHTDGYGGSVGEVLVYNTVLSSTDITTLHAYFANRWGTA